MKMPMRPSCNRRDWIRQSYVLGAMACLPVLALSQQREPPSPRELLQELIENARAPLLTEMIDSMPQCLTFSRLLKLSELVNDLESRPNLSVFIPVDQAWPATMNLVGLNSQTARQHVLRHVIDKRWNAVAQPIQNFTTLGGVNISVEVAQINQISFELQGLRVRNGYLHLIQGVL